MDIELLKNIYWKLGDDISREIFINRIMYNITGDIDFIIKCVKSQPWGSEVWEQLDYFAKNGEIVMFGAGYGCQTLLSVTSKYPWKCIIDNAPKVDSIQGMPAVEAFIAGKYILENNPEIGIIQGIPVVDAHDFLNNYDGENIVITSLDYSEEMYEQCVRAGIPREKIFNLGNIMNVQRNERQYFDLEYLKHADGREVFVDAGCYDGANSVQFSKWSKSDAKVYAIEPDADNVKVCQDVLSHNNISYEIYQGGVWSSKTTLCFNSSADTGSCISQDGDDVIEVISIDELTHKDKVTFIKMDIEGSELQALYGCENTIRNNKPKLAICVYHKPEDIWEIPELILKFNPEYKLYMRHYTIKDTETVLYAI